MDAVLPLLARVHQFDVLVVLLYYQILYLCCHSYNISCL
ncbi:hypothetical protein Rhein_2658 [Rheinheimera sp. A13L]|nr:hypothetical protein Rhein_2658 [Rheinheimera sp. A13L]